MQVFCGLVLFQDVCLDRAAHPLQRVGLDALVHLSLQNLIAAHAEQQETQAIIACWAGLPLVPRARKGLLGIDRFDLGFDLLLETLLANMPFALLIDRRIHEECQNHGSRPVDGHGDRGIGIGEIEA